MERWEGVEEPPAALKLEEMIALDPATWNGGYPTVAVVC